MKPIRLCLPVLLAAAAVLLWLFTVAPPGQANAPAAIIVTTTNDEFGSGINCSLREAIQSINTASDFGGCDYNGDSIINLGAGVYTLTIGGVNEDENATGDLDIHAAMTIQGNGPAASKVNADNIDRVFDIQPGAGRVVFDGISILNGEAGPALRDSPAGGTLYGGGVYVNSGTVVFTSTTIMNNEANGGGGVYAITSTLTFYQSILAANGADTKGAGVYAVNSAIDFDATVISDNHANSGGGIYVANGSVITLTEVDLNENMASTYGGGVYVEDSTARLESGQFGLNSADVSGGGIFIRGDEAYVQITGGEFSLNSTLGEGGGLYAEYATVEMSGGTITNNVAFYGGGVFLDEGASFLLAGGQIISNTLAAYGGGVFMRDAASQFTLAGDGLIAYNGSANDGGGICVSNGALFIEGGEIRNNFTLDRGGGVLIENGDAVMNGGVIRDNNAISGGGLYLHQGVATLTGTEILSNTAQNGAGIFLAGGGTNAITMTNVVIAGNSASQNGGGFYAASGKPLLRQTRIIGNHANDHGGGIFLAPDVWALGSLLPTFDPNLEMFGGGISENTSGGDGAGVYIDSGSSQATFKQVTIFGNRAGGAGGAIRAWGEVNIINTTISHNHAHANGGIFTDNASSIRFSTIANNTADLGPAIEMGDGPLELQNSIVAFNTPANCSVGLTSLGFNLDSGNTCGFAQPGDQHDANPLLGPLGNYGGNTMTRPLLFGSPAIDAGMCIPEITIDQRGYLRPDPISSFCDIGAFEASVGGLADLNILQTIFPASAAPGETITCTLAYSNTGPSGAARVTITDTLPFSLTGIAVTSSGAAIYPRPGDVLAWDVADFAPRLGGVITITGQLVGPLPVGVYTNTVTITGVDLDPNPADNVAYAAITVLNAPPVAADDAYFAALDTPLTVAAPGVLGNDSDPNLDDLAAVLDSPPMVGNLALAGDGSLVYTPTLGFSGVVTFTYHASDGEAASNVARVTITVTEEASTDLALSKAVSAAAPIPGDTLVYTITLTNEGLAQATGVVVTDLLPEGVSYVSDDSGGLYDPASGEWAVGSLGVGGSVALHITVTVDAGALGAITNTAAITALDQTDTNAANDTASAEFVVTIWKLYLPLIRR